MEDYLEAWIMVIIFFIAGLVSAVIIYYAIKVLSYVVNRNCPTDNRLALMDIIAWFFALLTWAIVDYLLFQYFS